jgi:energy-coupling factor transporter transmembrane protein EcfT
MDLYFIDYISVCGESWLHRIPAAAKMIAAAIGLILLLSCKSPLITTAAVMAMIGLALSARLPMKVFLSLMCYPLIFLAIIAISVHGLSLHAAILLITRVLAITGMIVLLLLTTSFPAIFATLGRILPGFLVAALFFTYRSLFVIYDSLANTRAAMHLRGGFDSKKPVESIKNFGAALGHFLVDSIESSQRMAESLQLRGFANKIYYTEVRRGRDNC